MENKKVNVDAAPVGRQKIAPIHAAPALPEENKWIPILKAFNPFGPACEAYARTLAYRIECKRLEAELTRIEKEAEINKNLIDGILQVRLEDLAQRRMGLQCFYEVVKGQLTAQHIERIKVLEMVEFVTRKVCEHGISFEERQLYKELSIELTQQLPKFGEQANQSLQALVQALPPVQIPERLQG